MRGILTLLVLVLQLQPLAGAVTCLAASMQVKRECSMPEHPAGDHRSSTTPDESPAPCPLAAVCAPTVSVMPRLATAAAADQIIEYLPTFPPSLLRPQEAPAPPFHPPRV